MCILIIAYADHFSPTLSQAQTLDILIAAGLFVTLATTLATILLISYRILSFSKYVPSHGSTTRFRYIIDILIQSAAVYSVSTISLAVASIICYSGSVALQEARNYTSTLYLFTAVSFRIFIKDFWSSSTSIRVQRLQLWSVVSCLLPARTEMFRSSLCIYLP